MTNTVIAQKITKSILNNS